MNMNSAVRRLVVGLGNPGDRFALTRHNVGALALDHIVEKFLPSFSSDPQGKDYKLQKSDEMNAFLCETNIGFFQGGEPGRDGRVVDYDFVDAVSSRRRARTRNEGVPFTNVDLVLMRPGTYMNQSGGPVRVFLDGNRYKLRSNPNSSNLMDELVVVFDDVSLPFGTIRFSPKGGHGGHNGVRDIIQCVNTKRFPRLRIGVGAAYDVPQLSKYVLSNFSQDETSELPTLLSFVSAIMRVYLHRGYGPAAQFANSMTSTDFDVYRRKRRSILARIHKKKKG